MGDFRSSLSWWFSFSWDWWVSFLTGLEGFVLMELLRPLVVRSTALRLECFLIDFFFFFSGGGGFTRGVSYNLSFSGLLGSSFTGREREFIPCLVRSKK